MQFDDHKKSRADLSGYFVKNAIPTESNFSDLISSVLNQRDDGVAKPPGGPLSVAGADDAHGRRRVLDLYKDFSDDSPTWSLSVGGAGAEGLGVVRGSDDAVALFLDFASGNIGVGTTQPAATLDVRGMISASGPIQPPAGAGGGIQFPRDPGGGANDAAWLTYFSRGGEAMTLQLGTSNDPDDHISLMPSGNVGVGTNTPTAKLDVQGAIAAGNSDLYFTRTDHLHTGLGNAPGHAAIENASNYNALMILGRAGPTGTSRQIQLWDVATVNGTLTVNGTFNNNSDRSVKRDIEDSPYGLDAVRRLRPVLFNWRHLPNPHKSVGLIAQEVQGVVDDAVYDDGDTLSVGYLSLIPVLIRAVQELDRRVTSVQPALPVTSAP